MQIILLCGGSGKRLWPLSNGVRSKQFLQLFRSPDGDKESMFQRVLRQIADACEDAEINVATSSSQVEAITAQLTREVSVIVEPSRRDTFPAIALAAVYLSKVKKLTDGETVIVMPCDTFTESGYFDTVMRMASEISQFEGDMFLMGITPTGPSSKYGYIVPNKSDKNIVDRFVEKPEPSLAARLIKEEALWNGGVFAFRLGYIRKIAEKYIQADSYKEFVANYDRLPKISFDYEVVEKTDSIGVMRYSGLWKDLGTWQSLCSELPHNTTGAVVDIDNRETTIINELTTPIISQGCRNLIVVASPDGILVADKNSADDLKESVNKVENRPMYEERRWGTYQVLDSHSLDNDTTVLTKRLLIKPGASISCQIHRQREETWNIVEGFGEVLIGNSRRNISAGDVIVIPTGTKHAILAKTSLTVIEIQRGHKLTEDDIERLEFNW